MTRHVGLVILFFFVVLFASQDVFPAGTPIEALVPKTAPDGWALRDSPETFTKETLFEHIDGQADLFLQYGFENSVLGIYRKGDSSEDKIDVDIYDMGNSLQAFGVFSRFRQDDKPAGIGLDSYLADNYALFYKGKYFVVLQATDANPSTLKGLAKDIESRISDQSPSPQEIRHFPPRGLKAGSIEYYPDGLLGHQFLKSGFKASYVENDKTGEDAKTMAEERISCLFLSIFENPQEAVNAMRLFREYLSKKGRIEGTSTQFGPDALVGKDPHQGKIAVVQKGPYLVGATGFEQDREGEHRLAELMKEIK